MKKIVLIVIVIVIVIVNLLFAVSAGAVEMPTISSSPMNCTTLTSTGDSLILGSTGTTNTTTLANLNGQWVDDRSILAYNEDGKRYIQIFIADPDKRVPVEQSVLYKSEPFMTDLTDRELYFTIEVVKLLADYNKKRVKMIDKDASKNGRDVYLEPIKIRDLKMVVVNIAVF